MAKKNKRGAKKKKLRNKRNGTAERLEWFGRNPSVRITYFVIATILAAIVALATFGDDLPGALQTLRESGRLRPNCVFDPAAEGEALIVILPFYVTSSGSSNAHKLIHEAIESEISNLGLEDVRVDIDPNVILEVSERELAQELGESCNAAVVIWGEETRTSIKVNFLNVKQPVAPASDERIRILAPDTLVGTEFIEGHLPGQLAFLSLFALGQAVTAEGEYTDAIPIVEEAVESISEELIAGESASPDSAAAAYLWLGWLYSIPPTQDYRQARDAYEKGLEFNSTNDRALGSLGIIYSYLGPNEVAKDYIEQALAITQEIGDRDGEGAWLRSLGSVYESSGKYEEAIDYYEQALAIAEEFGDRDGAGTALGYLGSAYLELGQYEAANDYFEQAQAIAQQFGDRDGEGTWLLSLGVVYEYLGEYEKAKDYHENALAITQEIGDRQGEMAALGRLGITYRNLRQFEEAIDYHEQALAIAQEFGYREFEGDMLGSLGNVYGGLEQYEVSKDYIEQALAIAQEIGDRSDEGTWFGNLGIVYEDLGDYEKAIDYHEQALTIAQEISDRAGEGRHLGNLGGVYYIMGQYEEAKVYYKQALAITQEIGDRRGEGVWLGNLGGVYYGLGEYEEAIKYLEQSLSILEEIKSPYAENTQRLLERALRDAGGG